jgi:hypothetical protein
MNKQGKAVKPNNPKVTMFLVIGVSLVAFMFLYFVCGDTRNKLCAIIVTPIMIAYGIYAYLKEKKQDKIAIHNSKKIMNNQYFESLEWREQYFDYRKKYSLTRPKKNSMKADLCSYFRNGESVSGMILGAFILVCSILAFCYQQNYILILGILLGLVLFSYNFCNYFARPVRRWYKEHSNEYLELEQSYLHGKIANYKTNGIVLGTTHVHCFTTKKLYHIEYSLVDGIKRKVVRVKKYDNSVYSGDTYKHYAVILYRSSEDGPRHELDLELNEFQVQMVMEEFLRMKLGRSKEAFASYTESYDNNVT